MGLLKEWYILSNLVTVETIGKSLHDAGEDHEDCADTDADDDVFIRLVLVSSCACQHFEEHVSGYDLVSLGVNVKVDSIYFELNT